MTITDTDTRRIAVENPSTGEIIDTVPNLDAEEVSALVAAARAAQPGWAALGFSGRGRYLRRMQKWFVDNADLVAESIHAENGKSIDESHIEVTYGASASAFWARKSAAYLGDERIRSRSPFVLGRKLVVRYAPAGVVGVIGPWNNPLLNNFGDIIPALAAGNTAILKPSEVTPLTSVLMERMAGEIDLPLGVFAVATGDGATGAALVEEVDALMFTGSTATGKKVAARCGERLIPCSLELGGKDPAIVLADADLDRAAKMTLFGAMHNSGQTCTSVERVLVEAPVYDEFVAKMTALFESLRLGESTGLGTSDCGSLTFPPQLDTVTSHVNDAIARGARAATGGAKRGESGRFFEPTVLVDVTEDMDCMREETFGPTLPILKVANEDEAVRIANSTVYGLQASIYTKDKARGQRVARRLEAGTVTIKDVLANYMALELPMGGWKDSGLGARHGVEGIRKFTKRQSILLTRFPLKNELHAMPFQANKLSQILKLTKLLYGHPRRT